MKLARWNNRHGSSSGVWLISDIEGLVLLRQYFYGYWKFAFAPASHQERSGSGLPPRGFLGDERERFPVAAKVLDSRVGQAQYPSRSQALVALQGVLRDRKEDCLGEILQSPKESPS